MANARIVTTFAAVFIEKRRTRSVRSDCLNATAMLSRASRQPTRKGLAGLLSTQRAALLAEPELELRPEETGALSIMAAFEAGEHPVWAGALNAMTGSLPMAVLVGLRDAVV